MTDVIGIVVTMEAKPEKADALADLLATVAKQTKTEEGCILYDLHRQVDAPERFVFFERWNSEAAVDAHMKAFSSSEEMKTIGGMLASRPTIVKLQPIAI